MSNVVRAIPFGLLPTIIKDRLADVGYSRSTAGSINVQCQPSGQVHTNGISDDGSRALCVDISDVEPDAGADVVATTEWGSYGGPSPYEKRPIDVERARQIAPRGAIITGHTSHKRTSPWVTVYVRPYLFAELTHHSEPEFLTIARDAFTEGRHVDADLIAWEGVIARVDTEPDPLTTDERRVMYAYGCIKSGPYRRDELSRAFEHIPTELHREAHVNKVVSDLIVKGFLRRNGAGSVSMTVDGKNTRKQRSGSGW